MRFLLGMGAAVMLLAGQASAGFVGFSGDAEVVTAGTGKTVERVLNNFEQNRTKIWGFSEVQSASLDALKVDANDNNIYANAETIKGDFASHFIFFNGNFRNQGGPNPGLLVASFTFDQQIRGVMSDSAGRLESESTGVLGFDQVRYPRSGSDGSGLAGGNGASTYLNNAGAFSARGLENSNGNNPVKLNIADFNSAQNDAYFIDGTTIHVKMLVTQPGDWIRVVTDASESQPGQGVVPEPTGIVLWSLGAAGLAFVRGRRKLA